MIFGRLWRSAVWGLLAVALMATLAACGTFVITIEHYPSDDMPDQESRTAAAEVKGEDSSLVSSVSGTVAYVQGGDIWVKRLPDGEAQRITQDGRNRRPLWSSSGEWLAFLKGTDVGELPELWVARSDGSDAQSLGDVADKGLMWSPVDDRLAFAHSAGIEVWSPEEAEPLLLVDARQPDPAETPARELRATQPVWSPDGTSIAYLWGERILDEGEENLTNISNTIRMVPANGGEPVILYDTGMPEKGDAILAGWSGGYLLFWQAPILSASILADGVPLYSLAPNESAPPPVELSDSVLVHADFVTVKPQGWDMAAVVEGGYRATWTNKQLVLVQAGIGDGERRDLLSLPGQAATSPAWSPDGRSIAYAAMPDAGDLGGGEDARAGLMQRRIWAVAVGESAPRQLTADEGYRDESPRWTAHGGHILFARMDDVGAVSLWLVNAEGGNVQQVVEELTPSPEWFGYYGYIDWRDLFDMSR